MNLHHEFVQVSKLSEDQKMEHFFSPNSGEDQKKRSSPTMEDFFPRIQVETCAQMHARVKLLEGMQMKTILKLLGGIQSNYCWGIYPPSWVSAPLVGATKHCNQTTLE